MRKSLQVYLQIYLFLKKKQRKGLQVYLQSEGEKD